MIELAMIFALGFLAAALLALFGLPVVARRAQRLATASLERRMPVSMAEIAAERDQRRAAHAVEIRRVEQRAEALDARVAASMAESGRQASQLIALKDRNAADAAMIDELSKALAETRRSALEAEATAGAQAIALREFESLADRRREMLEAATARLADADAFAEEQRTMLAALEAHVTGEPAPIEHGRADRTLPETLTDDIVQLRAVLSRVRIEQDMLRKGLAAATGERDRLRLRVDQLLLHIEDLQDSAEQAGDEAVADRQRSAQQEQAITLLTARLGEREEALVRANKRRSKTARRRPVPEPPLDPRPDADTTAPSDDAALRSAISALAADLLRYASDRTDAAAEQGSEAVASQYRLPLG